MIDFNKPMQTKQGCSIRILCTDRVGKYPIVGMFPDGELRTWTKDGRVYAEIFDEDDLINVPPPKIEKTYELVMHRSKRNGNVVVGKHEPGWQPRENEVLARKTVTITEGEGI